MGSPSRTSINLHLGGLFQTNLIMPELCPFLSRKLKPCSIVRPTEIEAARRHGM
jgi:hypothetical protein